MNEALESLVKSGFRPANLPPKTQREVERHQAHVEAVLSVSAPRVKEESIAREAERRALDALWRTELVTGSELVLTDQMRRLWAEYGLPSPFVRNLLWPLLSPTSPRDPSAVTGDQCVRLITLDVQRTLPFLGITNEPEKSQKCEAVLNRFCGSEYVQGMSYVAVRLMVELSFDEAKTYSCLDRLLRQSPTIACMYRLDLTEIENSVEFVLDSVAWANVPALWLLLKKLQFQSIQWFFLDWGLTVFVKSFSLKISGFVLDMIFLNGDVALYQAAVAVLLLIQDELVRNSGDTESARQTIAKAGDLIDYDSFVKSFHEVIVPPAVVSVLNSVSLFSSS